MGTFYDDWLATGDQLDQELRRTMFVARDRDIPWVKTRQDAKCKLMISNEIGYTTMGSNVLKGEIPVGWHTGRHAHGEESIYFLSGEGFTVVDRRWVTGWFEGATDGPQQAACRGAALVRFLKTSLAPSAPLCATGNSGGSAELGYELTWQHAGASLDFAMPSSGPFHRLDLGCQGDSDADWPAECAALKAADCPDCASKGCQLSGGVQSLLDLSFGSATRCSAPTGTDLDTLKAASPVDGPYAATLDGVPTHFLEGKLDPGPYMPLSTALHDALKASGADVEITYVDGADHEIDQSTEGAHAILDNLVASCKAR